MDSVHSSSSQEAGPEGIPDDSVSTVIGTPMIVDLQSNQTAAVDTGTPVSSALQNPQPTAGTTGNPVSSDVQHFHTAPESSGSSSESESPFTSKSSPVTRPKPMESWDAVLADVAERKIADIWANWRHSRIMARRLKKPTHSNTTLDPSVAAVGSVSNPLLGPSVEAEGSTQTNCNDTPNVDAAKRKRTGTPGSAEPPPKKSSSLADGLAYSRVVGSVSVPKTKKTLPHFVGSHTQRWERTNR